MERVIVWGGGELGATLVRRLAALELAREVVLVEDDESRARGKALDLMQSGPVDGSDTRVVGGSSLDAGPAEVLVVADPAELADGAPSKASLDRIVAAGQGKTVLVAGLDAVPIVEGVVNRGLPRDRVVGSLPEAEAAAVRHALAREIEVQPSQVALSLIGAPGRWLVPAGTASASGLPVDETWPVAVRRALAETQRRRRGPVVLAHAAARVLRALAGRRDTILSVVVLLQGELGRRGVALGVPARLGGWRLRAVVEPVLQPVDRMALDNATDRRRSRD
jgi:malate dehydrogenase